MADKPNAQTDPNSPVVYQIRIKGHLGQQWAAWFADMSITQTGSSETIITGAVIDQAALYGLLRKVRDLGLPLIAVEQIQPGQAAGDQ